MDYPSQSPYGSTSHLPRLLLLAFLCTVSTSAAAAPDGLKAKEITSQPGSEFSTPAASKIAGWADVIYAIDDNGYAFDIVILDSSIFAPVERAMIAAFKQNRNRTVAVHEVKPWLSERQLIWNKTADLNARVGFRKRRLMTKMLKASEKGHVDRLNELLLTFERNEYLSSKDISYLNAMWAVYYELKGDTDRSRVYKSRATRNATQEMYDGRLADMLSRDLEITLTIGNLGEVERRLKRLRKISPKHALAFKEKYKDTYSKIDQSGNFSVSATLVNPCVNCEVGIPVWSQTLYHQIFKIDNIDGEISSLRLYCDHSYEVLTTKAGTIHTASRQKGNCQAVVIGKEETTFTFTEFNKRK